MSNIDHYTEHDPKMYYNDFKGFEFFFTQNKLGTLLCFINKSRINYKEHNNIFQLTNFINLKKIVNCEKWSDVMEDRYESMLDIIYNKEDYINNTKFPPKWYF